MAVPALTWFDQSNNEYIIECEVLRSVLIYRALPYDSCSRYDSWQLNNVLGLGWVKISWCFSYYGVKQRRKIGDLKFAVGCGNPTPAKTCNPAQLAAFNAYGLLLLVFDGPSLITSHVYPAGRASAHKGL